MIELHFLRHAHAGDGSVFDGPDSARPLTEKGERQADRLGTFLARVGFVPDAIVSSPKVRAVRTAEIVALHLGLPFAIDDRLAGALDLESLDALLTEAGDPARPVLVGHDPDFSELVSLLAGVDHLPMRKGSLARIDLDRPLRARSGCLRWLVPPDLL